MNHAATTGRSSETSFATRTADILRQLGLERISHSSFVAGDWIAGQGAQWTVASPIDGQILGEVTGVDASQFAAAVSSSLAAYREWRMVPAPVRGELVRRIGDALRAAKPQLAELVTIESGKILQEGLGEVQEMIDICDFAVGLSRQLYGLTMPSERAGHRLMEQWHPLGPVGVISAFNFPVAVWSWNAMLALVCGDPVLWKPSEKTPLTAVATLAIAQRAVSAFDAAPAGLLQLLQGDRPVGQWLAESSAVPLVSATGSTAMGRSVAQTVAGRLGRTLLELGGNNAAIVMPSADLDLAVRGILFSAVGTCGQRCTTLRRLIVHEDVADALLAKLRAAWQRIPIGNPLESGTLVGPLIDRAAFEAMERALDEAADSGATIEGGRRRIEGVPAGGYYVQPALVQIDSAAPVLQRETFAPILYWMTFRDLDEAIALQNGVPQGLSSSIFTLNAREAERFLSPSGSDCGLANVNIGTSGAEIGGAFGGEKETGGGRESGSDAWRNYMRRATNTINYSTALPLAQGIRFEL